MTSEPATIIEQDDLQKLARHERWADVCHAYERVLNRDEKRDAGARLYYAIALIQSGRMSSGLNAIDQTVAAHPDARIALRRHVIPTLIESKRLEAAIAVLSLLIDINPGSVDDLRLRGSLYGRSKQFPPAVRDAKRLIDLQPTDQNGQTAYLQLLLQSNQSEEAGRHALQLGDEAIGAERLASIALLSLSRAGLRSDAVRLADTASTALANSAPVMAAAGRAYLDAGLIEKAIAAGEHCLRLGNDTADVRKLLGCAYQDSTGSDHMERALEHAGEAVRQAPTDASIRSLLGEMLMRSGRSEEAIPHLAAACAKLPNAANQRALLARAYKQSGRAADAAREFRRLLELQPESSRWHRYAAGALSQAGHKDEATEIFDAFTAKRRSVLPANFEHGLEALWEQTSSLTIPQARLDWAWQLRGGGEGDRAAWEKAAKWGHLADHYILDWLECRDELAHAAMGRLADLGDAERAFAAVDRSRGMILASAHVGAMFAGPLALELLDVRSKWLASTPGVARTSYAQSLISTSDQTGSDVARRVLSALHGGNAVVIAVDGAINFAAPRIAFEGQEITYSSFASRMAHKLNIPSMFVAPYWKDGQIHFDLQRLPDPIAGETVDEHSDRWRDAFVSHLRRFLGGAPENLRLSGGLWRHIRPMSGA